jgi:hypothetical protein
MISVDKSNTIKNNNKKLRSKAIDKIKDLEKRTIALETKLEEKDRELREISINRAEFIQQLDLIYKMLQNTRKQSFVSRILNDELEKPASDESDKDQAKQVMLELKSNNDDVDLEIHDKQDKQLEGLINTKPQKNLKPKSEPLDLISIMEPNKLEFLGKYSYRERMILMNRIDIYRLYITVIILSSQIKYPRALTNIEEKEIKEFIDELSEFENIVLDLNAEEEIIWEKGKVCEKRATQLFSRFFNI